MQPSQVAAQELRATGEHVERGARHPGDGALGVVHGQPQVVASDQLRRARTHRVEQAGRALDATGVQVGDDGEGVGDRRSRALLDQPRSGHRVGDADGAVHILREERQHELRLVEGGLLHAGEPQLGDQPIGLCRSRRLDEGAQPSEQGVRTMHDANPEHAHPLSTTNCGT